jgi:3-isopropylmalate/(R)-2-methylmalate dehydratase small subunit
MKDAGVIESRTFNLPVDNIDTDQIIPAQFLTTTEREGLGKYCFHGWRYGGNGQELPGHPLTGHRPGDHEVLVSGSNFGCGSSREHAPWALLDFGFKAVISSRFADIFRANALKNGLLPVELEAQAIEFLMAHPETRIRIDINRRRAAVYGCGEFEFPLDPFSAYCIIRGIDQLDFILEHEALVGEFEQRNG